ncbi:MAG TPA: GNAT family protein [Jatrophihabitans sp.]|jgi:aminoglycoside 6'-N-acetyltransferase|uniref:GNAT family N-acetyltransferase n=1 Tax=Jatrophihabitans sp. TaxID=1932789 RepID=UPI002E031B29|nr:GNAT family protein [Jatrophihabitans sp.]
MVTLRPFTEAELGYFDDLPGYDDDPYSFYGFRPGTSAHLRGPWAENQFLSDSNGMLAVVVDGEVIGDVQFRALPYGPPPMSNALNIGIRVLPAYQGNGHGTAAQAALVEYLFATYPVHRIDAHTDITNRAEQRSLEKAGFTREGVVRGAQWRDGRYNDMVVYSRLRTD